MNSNQFRSVALLLFLLVLAGCDNGQPATILVAKNILTLEEQVGPDASAVLIENGIIRQVGRLDELMDSQPSAIVDRRYEDKVLIPGLIDPHVHMLLASVVYSRPFIPPWDMYTPKGKVDGVQSLTGFLDRLAEINQETNSDDPLIVYGYHNLVHGDLTKEHLDKISKTRPILVWHYSIHDFYLNTAALEWAGVDESWIEEVQGVATNSNGELTGRLYEEAPKKLLGKLSFQLLGPSRVRDGFEGYEHLLRQSGVTAVADLGYGIFGKFVEDFFYWREYNESDAYLLYLVPEYRAFSERYGDDAPQKIRSMSRKPFDRDAPNILPQAKFFVDGAFYSQTMRLTEPGYLSGQSQGTRGEWATAPKLLTGNMKPFWEEGLSLRVHSNGDAAQSQIIEAIRELSPLGLRSEQRVVLEHAALINPFQRNALAELGVGVSFASHYLNHMGEDYKKVLGNKISDLTPIGSLYSLEVPASLHSDAPLAPPSPLKAAASQVMRNTRQGSIVGQNQRLTRLQALKSITINAAWAMGLEQEMGSIAEGKQANLTVLGMNPLTTPAEHWSRIPIHGVVVQGRHFETLRR